MKKLVCVLVLMFFNVASVYAADNATLNVKVAGTSNSNTYFLCMEGTGCVSMFAADHGHQYPINSGKVHHIYVVDATNLKMYPQAMPASCQVNVNNNQTLTVSGRMEKGSNSSEKIAGIKCAVT